jgi:hypothetical protein
MANPLSITKAIGETIGNSIGDKVAGSIPDALVVDVPDVATLGDATTYSKRAGGVLKKAKTGAADLVEKVKGVEEDSILNQKPQGLAGYKDDADDAKN